MKVNISPYQSALGIALDENGWQIASVEEPDLWWCHEFWQLRSIWRPRELQAYLTFLIDPMTDAEDLAQGVYRVWAVRATANAPGTSYKENSALTMYFGSKWQERMPKVIDHLSKLRDQANNQMRPTPKDSETD